MVRLGAMPQRLYSTTSRPATFWSCTIRFRRAATFSLSERFTSRVPRLKLALPRPTSPLMKLSALGALVARLTAPPAEPRPPKAELGPLMTSTCSRLKISRVCEPTSRIPSTYTSDCASKPRMKGRSAAELPPSPAPKVTPGVRRKASCKVVAPVCSMTVSGITVTVLGVSSSGAVNFWLADLSTFTSDSALALTSTAGKVPEEAGAV